MKIITKGVIQSTFAKEFVALPTPCNDVVYYPAKLADLATEEIYTVFQTLSQKVDLLISLLPSLVRQDCSSRI